MKQDGSATDRAVFYVLLLFAAPRIDRDLDDFTTVGATRFHRRSDRDSIAAMQRTVISRRGRVGVGRALAVACGLVSVVAAKHAEAATGVACIGDSITQGSGWCEGLGTMLGAEYDVRNFGLSGTTLLKAGDHPYWTSDQYTQSHAFAPNIVIIMLGTNDSKPQNWSHKDQFVSDYGELIDSYATLASAPKIYLNLPPPAGTNGFGISGMVIENEVVPLVQQVAANKHTGLIDVFSAFGGHDFDASLFGSPGDQVHPNGAGGQRIAETVYAALTAPPVVDAGADASEGEDGGAAVDGSVPSAGASGGGTDGGGSGGAPANAGAGGETAGSPNGSGGVSGSGGSASGGDSATSSEQDDDDDGGCAVTSGGSGRGNAWAFGAAIATLWAARRRRSATVR